MFSSAFAQMGPSNTPRHSLSSTDAGFDPWALPHSCVEKFYMMFV